MFSIVFIFCLFGVESGFWSFFWEWHGGIVDGYLLFFGRSSVDLNLESWDLRPDLNEYLSFCSLPIIKLFLERLTELLSLLDNEVSIDRSKLILV